MLTRLPLRTRIFLLFAGLLAGLLAVLGAGLWVAVVRLRNAGPGLEAAGPPGMVDALALAALIAGLGMAGLVAGLWYLFDSHLVRPIEALTGGLLTGARPDATEGRYLADLTKAARAAAEAQSRQQAQIEAALSAQAEGQAREKSMLEKILCDIGAGAILTGARGQVLFYNAAAAQMLPGLALDRDLARLLRPAGWQSAQARLQAGAQGCDVALQSVGGARLSGRLRHLPDERGGQILILRPARREPSAPRAALLALRETLAARGVAGDELPELAAVERALVSSPPRQRRASGVELAQGLGLPLGKVTPVTLAADGWQIGGLLAMLAGQLRQRGAAPEFSLTARGELADLTLAWQGAALPDELLAEWVKVPPDPDQPELTGRDILDGHAATLRCEVAGNQARLILTLSRAPIAHEDRPAVTYDFTLANSANPESCPLAALTCVVFDTETTGLDPSDRIVQIAGLRIAGGKLTGERFDMLVNPARPIPKAATSIHGITDQMVASAPDLGTALLGFHHFAEGAVLVAHNAPFDMGFLRAAEPETGQHFPNPVLDTVLLSAMIWGQGAGHSLDALCARLDITLDPALRHTAMGDAEATAKAYLRMLPALAAKGITRFDDVTREARKLRGLLGDANLRAR